MISSLSSYPTFLCVCVCVRASVPAKKRALEGQDSEHTSAPSLLAQVSWARGAGFPLGRHFTASEEHTKSHHRDNYLDMCTHTYTATQHSVGAYQCSLSCSSAVSVQVDTHTHSCPGCLRSRAHSYHCWCCTHRCLKHSHREHDTHVWIFTFCHF